MFGWDGRQQTGAAEAALRRCVMYLQSRPAGMGQVENLKLRSGAILNTAMPMCKMYAASGAAQILIGYCTALTKDIIFIIHTHVHYIYTI